MAELSPREATPAAEGMTMDEPPPAVQSHRHSTSRCESRAMSVVAFPSSSFRRLALCVAVLKLRPTKRLYTSAVWRGDEEGASRSEIKRLLDVVGEGGVGLAQPEDEGVGVDVLAFAVVCAICTT